MEITIVKIPTSYGGANVKITNARIVPRIIYTNVHACKAASVSPLGEKKKKENEKQISRYQLATFRIKKKIFIDSLKPRNVKM